MELKILYQDAYCLVVNKPNNILVHHSRFARNIETPSMIEVLREHGFENACPIHRLDHKTSGVILFAKHADYVKAFQGLFESKTIQKVYWALLRGFVPEKGIIDSPVKNERGNYKEAYTSYRTLKHFTLNIPVQPYNQSRYSLVEFIPQTGRMHQLRIHANKISHPIIGDPKYGNRHHNHMFQDQLNIPYLFLHAKQVAFDHPYTEEKLSLVADLPEFWDEFFSGIDLVETID